MPRSSTATPRPPAVSSCTGLGSANTVVGSGSGRLPGQGAEGEAGEGRSPHGTSSWRSASQRPPPIRGVSTPSWPSMPCTRDSTWCTRSSVPVPNSPGTWLARASTATGSSRMPVTALPSWSPAAACSCQRIRSTTAGASNMPGVPQVRATNSSRSPVNSIRSSVQASPAADSPAMNCSTVERAVNATWSIRDSGGSNAICRTSSGGGTRGCTTRGSAPDASVCRRSPCWPNRSRTAVGPSAAKPPRVCTPSRGNSVVSVSSPSRLTGSGARNAADSPDGTTRTGSPA